MRKGDRRKSTLLESPIGSIAPPKPGRRNKRARQAGSYSRKNGTKPTGRPLALLWSLSNFFSCKFMVLRSLADARRRAARSCACVRLIPFDSSCQTAFLAIAVSPPRGKVRASLVANTRQVKLKNYLERAARWLDRFAHPRPSRRPASPG